MKTIIAGSRDFNNYATIKEYMQQLLEEYKFKITEVVSGGAKGVDSLGEQWAKENNIPVKVFKADWKKYDRAAGPIRNRHMVEYSDILIAFWDGESPGTKNCIEEAKRKGIKVYIRRTDS